MKTRLLLLFRIAIFWLIFMIFARLSFMFYQAKLSFELSIFEWIKVFWFGLRMDISATGYVLTIIALILTFSVPFKGKYFRCIINIMNGIFLFLFAAVFIIDMELYRNWGFRIDSTPLLYITQPKEAMASTEGWLTFLLVTLLVSVYIGFSVFYKKMVDPYLKELDKEKFWYIPVFILITGSMIIPVRASFGIAPLNVGMVYHSKNQFANHSAINAIWNFGNSAMYSNSEKNDYAFIDKESAVDIFNEMNQESGESVSILNNDRPNIVVLILESFSNKVIGTLGGIEGVTPNFNRLSEDGILFSQFYSSSDRSDKGLVAILSGFPTHPTKSIIKFPGKSQKLPFISEELHQLGYNSAFYYGGDLNFANMRSYVSNAGFQKVVSMDDFDASLHKSKWGVHDEYVFDRFYEDLLRAKEPYLKVFFTLSSHDPFEVPMETVIEGNDRPSKYMNSIYYADLCLGNFFDKIRESSIWESTLFVLVADHGSPRPGNSQIYEPEKYQVPLLFTGGVVEIDSVIHKPAMQVDIATTLLHQLGVESDQFNYSHDLFSENDFPYAIYTFNNGFGLITDTSEIIFSREHNQVVYPLKNEMEDTLLIKGKAYIQYLIDDFIAK